MRNPERIKPFLDELEKIWNEVPDWRFGQLVVNLFGTDPFYIEDEQALEIIKKLKGDD